MTETAKGKVKESGRGGRIPVTTATTPLSMDSESFLHHHSVSLTNILFLRNTVYTYIHSGMIHVFSIHTLFVSIPVHSDHFTTYSYMYNCVC